MRRENLGAIGGLELFEGALTWTLAIAGAVMLVVTGYYVYGMVGAANELFRGLAPGGAALTAADFQRNLGNMEMLTRLLLLAAVVGSLTAVLRFGKHAEAGGALLVAGIALFLGFPFLAEQLLGVKTEVARPLASLGDPRAFLTSRFQLAGIILAGVGGAHLLYHAIAYIAVSKSRRPRPDEEAAKAAAQVRKPQDRFLGKCWELPFCRDTERKLCPIRTTKKPCWRTGRGCYCDQQVIITLSGGGNTYQAGRGPTGYLIRSVAAITRPKTFREKREACLQCPVYLHHQGQKYRLIVPFALLAFGGALFYFWSNITSGYPQLVLSLGRSLSGFSFGPQSGGVPPWASDMASNAQLMWIVLGVSILMLVAYLVNAIEWALYRLGI